ncbi:hypothetical protein C0991_009713 [Blastosporella zonata]|nr:hypothetical protein C0991_009713 [Blastosporella zonata]
MYLRGNKIEYDALETLGANGWNWDSMFSASEHFFPPSQSDIRALGLTYNPAFHGFSGPIALSIQAQNVSE